MWVDPNLNDFYSRVSRIEKAHAKGYGFEAAGTLGRSSSYGRKQSAFRFVKPLILLLVIGALLKGTIYYYIGADTYNARVQTLMAGEGFDPVGGWLMQTDPVSMWVATQFQAAKTR